MYLVYTGDFWTFSVQDHSGMIYFIYFSIFDKFYLENG